MPSKKPVIKSYVTENEYARIAENASRAKLSLSDFVRRTALGYDVKSREDALLVRELVTINADMGRLGGLLKLWLTSPDRNQKEVRQLLYALESAKELLTEKIKIL